MVYVVILEGIWDDGGDSIMYASDNECDSYAELKRLHDRDGTFRNSYKIEHRSGSYIKAEYSAYDLYGDPPPEHTCLPLPTRLEKSLPRIGAMLNQFYAPAIQRQLEEPAPLVGLATVIGFKQFERGDDQDEPD